jgi:protein-S-isoprenylcysteine O-methyltransferase Ste14
VATLRLIAWIVCGIYSTIPAYWIVVHAFAPRWRRARYKLKLLAPLWVLMWCVAWAASYPWREAVLYRNPGTWVAAPLLWAVSVFMYVNGGRELSFMRLIGQHELEPEKHAKMLITFGVHRLVRHPLYLGHFCTMLGWALGAGTIACFALFACAVASGVVMVRLEERELHARFGSAWEEYCEHTPAIFPVPKD